MSATVLTQNAYVVGVHPYSFRVGEPGEIIGTQFVKPRGKNGFGEPYDWRLAYIVQYNDGVKDYVAIEDVTNGNFAIISETFVQLAHGQIPKH